MLMDPLRVLRLSLIIAIIAYLGFNFTALYLNMLPLFLYIENFIWILCYVISLLFSLRGMVWPSLLVSSFNAGRISNTIITSSGSLHILALQHLPLFALLALIMTFSIVYMVRRCG